MYRNWFIKNTKESDIMKFKSLKSSLMVICVTMSVVIALIIGSVGIYYISTSTKQSKSDYEAAMYGGYNTEIKSETQTVLAVLQSEYDKYKNGNITEAEAKEEAKEIVRAMRYREDKSGYFWIDDTDYTLIMHPVLSKQEGTNRHDLKDQNGVMIIQEIMKVAETGGYNEFYFTKSDGVTVAPKIAYSQEFTPWKWVISTGNYVDEMNAEMASTESAITAQFQHMCIVMICVTILLIILVIIITARIAKKIVAPITRIKELATRLSQGDLTKPAEVKETNEIGKTADALNQAQVNINELIANITQLTQDVSYALTEFGTSFGNMGSSITEVSAAVDNIAGNISTQAESTNTATVGIDSIAEGISNTNNEVGHLNETSQLMMELSRQALETLNELVEVNKRTKNDITLMYKQTEITNESVQNIKVAADLINGISSQTNLLSLNASIEAARAGEQGRGFAVVANEIGSLADQSTKTVDEISKIIAILMSNSAKSVEIMEGINSTIDMQVQSLNETQMNFNNLYKNVGSCIDSVNSIDKMTEIMESQRKDITQVIQVLNGLAQNNAAAIQQTSVMAEELSGTVQVSGDTVNNLSQDVKVLLENVNKFKTN